MRRRLGPAYQDSVFLESEEGRPVRILAEYFKPLAAFEQASVQDTVVFFGSARLTPNSPMGHYLADARELARRVTEWSMSLRCDAHRFVVCSGGGGGIMEAANQGAAEAGGRTIGLNIGLPREQRPNPYISPELGFEFRYFFMRKLWFAHLARAMVVFPGGFGTLDELFELLTLSQTRKLSRPILVLLYGRSYWEQIINFDALVKQGMIEERDLSLFHYVDTPSQAMDRLRQELSRVLTEPESGFARSRCCDPVAEEENDKEGSK